MGGVAGIDPRPLTLRELRPLARGAWMKIATQTVEIVNAIPRFSKTPAMQLADLDHYSLLEPDADDAAAEPDRIPYNPAVLQALQDSMGE